MILDLEYEQIRAYSEVRAVERDIFICAYIASSFLVRLAVCGWI